MALDIWVYGPGYGETIVLCWDEENKEGDRTRVAAVIDCFGGEETRENPALKRLKELGNPVIAFVAVTHPHFDHLRNFHRVLIDHQHRIERIYWWGGLDAAYAIKRYHGLAEDSRLHNREPGLAADMARNFLSFARGLAGEFGGRRRNALFQSLMGDSPAEIAIGAMKVRPIAPWEGPLHSYIRDFRTQFRREAGRTVVAPDRVRANRASLGFLLEYCEAQVLLGGDIEAENWEWFRREWGNREKILRPQVIKVSHHGSESAVISGMWEKNSGFFQELAHNQSSPQPPICVITPWRSGRRRLPLDTVIQKIQAAGCRVVVTGSPPGARGGDLANRFSDSYVHIRLEKNGKSRVVSESQCEIF